ncbi:hypothetical protein GQ43DRAFT_437607 [Delitschia confertaspora ATCC 74209]|uniref:Uncharacterized protein n=1 Tax=Delitschia confertaspora ATCC 74209 TaxID=1513339 RepID=A0A9P4JSN5_9PLEO|nr:hypothetical protein GQ43DRAFT_437607 [Delitschia confertaspora ATCC 74209]
MTVDKYQPLTFEPINFSLTEGTSIPAPPDSPPDSPRPPTPGKGPLSSHPTPTSVKSSEDGQLARKTTNDDASSTQSPASPTTGKRPSSMRKFLGFRSMSSSESLRSERPGSPATIDSQGGQNRKKSGSWFGNRRKSTMFMGPIPMEGKENHAPPKPTTVSPEKKPEKKGPPPPALPELKSFGVSDDTISLGADDMFKNIK